MVKSLPWLHQTRLMQTIQTISAVHSTASWGCWWAESRRCPRHPRMPSDVVLVSRHTLVFSSKRLLPGRMRQRRHPPHNPPAPLTVHPGTWTPNETERRHNVTDQWQSDWIGGGGGHCKSSDYFAVLCLRCGKVTQSFDWRLWVRQFIYCQAVGERTEAPRALNPVCSHLLEPARNVNSSRLSD